jgi:hypothetical protein
MAHEVMRAPNDLTCPTALRWGQVLGMGGDERLARAILATRLGSAFEHNEFWQTVIAWFIAHPLLDRVHVGPIIDYLHQQRFIPKCEYPAPGVRQVLPPAQPNLTMKGRSPESLLRHVEQWHRRLSNETTYVVSEWRSAGFTPFEFREGSPTNGTERLWTIRELLSSKALIAEGRQLKHCVASYARSCARGQSSIWTLEVASKDGTVKALTIEVRNQQRLLCQARGKLNRLPQDKERSVLRRWAAQAGLTIASYV